MADTPWSRNLNNGVARAKFKCKHKIPHTGRAGAQLPVWPGEQDLEVLVGSKLNVSQQQDLAVIKVNHIPGCVTQQVKGSDYSPVWGL